MKVNVHPTDPRWDELVSRQYGKAYPELVSLFRQLLGRAFIRTRWIPDPLALDYMIKILIRFLPVTPGRDRIEEALSLCGVESDDPCDTIRFYESVGELILWWSGVYRRSQFQNEGKRLFEIAYERLADYETPTNPFIVLPGQENASSKRLKVNKMFSEHFENYQEILEQSNLIDDPAYHAFRDLFMTDDFSIN